MSSLRIQQHLNIFFIIFFVVSHKPFFSGLVGGVGVVGVAVVGGVLLCWGDFGGRISVLGMVLGGVVWHGGLAGLSGSGGGIIVW